jgi:hypothetical protein
MHLEELVTLAVSLCLCQVSYSINRRIPRRDGTGQLSSPVPLGKLTVKLESFLSHLTREPRRHWE